MEEQLAEKHSIKTDYLEKLNGTSKHFKGKRQVNIVIESPVRSCFWPRGSSNRLGIFTRPQLTGPDRPKPVNAEIINTGYK